VYFASRSIAPPGRWLSGVARAASAAAILASGYALLQLAGLDPFLWTRRAVLGDYWRVPGTLGHANFLGAYLAMSLPLTFWLSRRSRSRAARVGWTLAILPGLLVLATTLSRGAWVALALGMAAYSLLARIAARAATAGAAHRDGTAATRGPRIAATAVALLAAVGVFLLPLLTPLRPTLLQRLRQITDVHAPSTESRVHLWRAGLRMAADHPLLGVGCDRYGAHFPTYRTPDYWRVEWNGTATKAHSEPLQAAATQGLPGLLAAALVALLAARALFLAARAPDAEARAGAGPAGASLTAFAVSGLVGFTVVSTGMLAAAVAGWASTASGRTEPRAHEAGEPPRPGPRAWVLAAVVAAAVFASLVLVPLRADVALARALAYRPGDPGRLDALARAAQLAPWDDRPLAELGRALLTDAFREPDPSRSWALLERARGCYDRAVRIEPGAGETRALLARVLAAEATLRPGSVSPHRVREAYRAALRADSTGASVLELAVQGLNQAGFHPDARTLALRAIRLYPQFALPVADLGTEALSEGRTGDAAETLAVAVGLNWHGEITAEAAAHANLAAAYLALGRARESQAEARRALELDPALLSARRLLDEGARFRAVDTGATAKRDHKRPP
jgi:O-antigen ligase